MERYQGVHMDTWCEPPPGWGEQKQQGFRVKVLGLRAREWDTRSLRKMSSVSSAYVLRLTLALRCQVSQEKGSGRKRAVEVVLVRTNREKREEDQLRKVSLSHPSWYPCRNRNRHSLPMKTVEDDVHSLPS